MSRYEEVWVPVSRLISSPCVTAAVAVCAFSSWGRRCPVGLVHTLSLLRGRILLLLRLLADYVPGVGFVTRKWGPATIPPFILSGEKSEKLDRTFVNWFPSGGKN